MTYNPDLNYSHLMGEAVKISRSTHSMNFNIKHGGQEIPATAIVQDYYENHGRDATDYKVMKTKYESQRDIATKLRRELRNKESVLEGWIATAHAEIAKVDELRDNLWTRTLTLGFIAFIGWFVAIALAYLPA